MYVVFTLLNFKFLEVLMMIRNFLYYPKFASHHDWILGENCGVQLVYVHISNIFTRE